MSKKDKTINDLLEALGSHEVIARRLAAATDFEIAPSGQTIRRWFRANDIPLEELLIMLDLADLGVSRAYEFHPYLRRFFEVKQ